MIRFTSKTRMVVQGGLALSLSMLALAACQNPGSAPSGNLPGSTGAAPSEAFAGSGGNLETRQYVAAPAILPIASVSASVNAGSAKNIIDNDTNSQWDSGTTSNPTVTLSLGSASELTEILVKVNPNVGTYAVQVSDDGASWKSVLTNQKNTSWNLESKKLPANTTGKQVRLAFANGGKRIIVFEVDLKGGAASVTPSPAPSTAPSTNPGGLSATASASNGTYVAGRAVDGNADTEWQSGAVANPTLTVDRGATGSLTALAIKANPNVGTYRVEVSDDGSSWKPALTGQSSTSWNLETKALPAGTSGRYVRLSFANGGKNVMVFEVQPQGATTSPNPEPSTAPSTAPSTVPSTAPSTAPSPDPSTAPTPVPSSDPGGGSPAPSGTAIVVNTAQVLHPADSHVLGTCRNHVTQDFPNGAAKVAKMRELTPTWGQKKYLYRIGHGPTDGRNDYSYMTGFHFEQVWNKLGPYPYDDIREGLKEANAMGADQMHVVNFGTSDPDEAGRYVSYLNKANDANRAKYPYAQQNVQMFELGNEISWDRVRGHSQYAPNETVYAQRAKLFAEKMRANSDVPIKIGAVATTNSNWLGTGWSGGATTVKNILTNMGSQVDFLIYHGYPSWPLYKDGDFQTMMAQNAWSDNKLKTEIEPAIKQYGGGRDIRIANTEFFTNLYNDVPRSRGLLGALYAADSVGLALNHNMMSAVEFCFEHKELGDAGFFIGNNAENVTAIFKFQKMLAQHFGDNVVAATGQQIPAKKVQGASTSLDMPTLGYVASTSGNKVYVMVTNRTNDTDVKSSVAVGFKPSSVTAYELSASNGWDATNADVQTKSNVSVDGYTFKKASVTILEITR